MDKLLITRKEAADALHISLKTLDDIRRTGTIKTINIGSRVFVDPRDIRALVDKKEDIRTW